MNGLQYRPPSKHIMDVRKTWDEMVEDAKNYPGFRHTLVLPQGARLESKLISTCFDNPAGGIVSVTVLDNGRWIIRSVRIRQGGRNG